MAFIKKGFAELYAQMERDARQRTPQLSDFQEGSVIRSLFESFAVELTQLYAQLDLVYQAGFIDTAADAHLDRVVAVLGIKRNEPDFAAGIVTFTRDSGSNETLTIPLGTLVTTEEDTSQEPAKKAYVTTETAQLAVGENAVDVHVQAEGRGRELTSDAATVVVMPRPVPGIKTVSNPKPIRFLGRDRESDAALRQRAKQGLLASGRASVTSIENALLSLPGVRQVRIKEEVTRPGVIQVYVDGLTDDNRPLLQDRIDQVRAAGIYVVLEPAQPIHLTVVLRITVDPRVKGEERLALERRVSDAVEGFVTCVPMGQPLLFAPLTAAVLGVKGVVDLEDFTLDATWPAGMTVLPAPGAPSPLPPTTRYAATARRIEAALYERFVPISVRTAADSKLLPIDVQVQVRLPGAAVRAQLDAHLQTLIDQSQAAARLLNSPAVVALVENVRPQVISLLQDFTATVKRAATRLDWTTGLDELTQTKLVAAIQSYFSTLQRRNAPGGGQVVANDILTQLQKVKFGSTQDKQWRVLIQQALAAQIGQFSTEMLTTFPDQPIEALLNAGAMTAYQTTIGQAQSVQQAALDQAEQQYRTETANLDPSQTADHQKLSAAQDNLRMRQKAATDGFAVSESTAAARREVALHNGVAQALALRAQTQAMIQQLADDETLLQLLSARSPVPAYDIGVRLRTLLFDGTILADGEQIEASFVEKPVPAILFVYSDRLELTGRLLLTLSPRATSEDKVRSKNALRQALEQFLAALQPEEEIDLGRLQQVVTRHGQASFAPEALNLVKCVADQRLPLTDRNDRQKIKVNFGEKVFLAAEPWFGVDVEQ